MEKTDKNNTKLLPLLNPSTKYLPSIKISYFDASRKERRGSPDMTTPSPDYTPLPHSDDSVNEALLRPSASEQSTAPEEGWTIYLSQVVRTTAAVCTFIPFIIYFLRPRGGTITAIVFLAIALADHIIALFSHLLSTIHVRIEFHDQPVKLSTWPGQKVARSSRKWQQYSDFAITMGLMLGVFATGHRGDTSIFVAIGFHWTAILCRALLGLGSTTKQAAWFNVHVRCGMSGGERRGDD